MINELKSTASEATRLTNRQKRMHDFLKEQHVGVLSTVDPDNNPHGVVVYYAIDPSFTLHILTKRGTKKYDNLMHNSHIMLTVFDPRRQTTVQVTGIATERGGQGNINDIVGAIFGGSVQTSDVGLPPIVKLQAGAFTTFSIEPMQIKMAIYARPKSGDYSELFESIESFDFTSAD